MWRANTQIQQDTISAGRRQIGNRAKGSVQHRQALISYRTGGGYRLRVAVKRREAALRAQALKYQTRVPTTAKSAIDVMPTRVVHKRIYRFVQEDGLVGEGCGTHYQRTSLFAACKALASSCSRSRACASFCLATRAWYSSGFHNSK